MAEVISELVTIIFEKMWKSGEVLCNWKRESIIPIFKKEKKNPRIYTPVSLTSRKIMEQVNEESISKHPSGIFS